MNKTLLARKKKVEKIKELENRIELLEVKVGWLGKIAELQSKEHLRQEKYL